MKLLAFDVETSGSLPEYGLQPHRLLTGESWLTSYATAMFRPDGSVAAKAYRYPAKAHLKMLLDWCAAHKVYLCGWNMPFDAAWPIAMGLESEVMACSWIDGLLLRKALEVEPEYGVTRSKKNMFGLKATIEKEYPQHAGYEEDIDFHATDELSIQKRLVYNRIDAVGTLKLTRKYIRMLRESNPQRLAAALIESKCIPLVAGTYVRGQIPDHDSLKALDGKLEIVAEQALTELSQYGATAKILASPKQLEVLMFQTWGLTPIKQTESGADSTDKEVLHELAPFDPRVKLVRNYREAVGNRTKFVKAIEKSAAYNGDDRVRPIARIFGTYTSRMTYSSKQGKNKAQRPIGYALHQMKRDKEFRKSIKAPEGYSILELDAAGQEFKWMAIASGDETMLSLCRDGEDPHSYMAAQIVGKDYHYIQGNQSDPQIKQDRDLGKFANLSFQYRISAKGATRKARVDYKLDVEEPFIAGVKNTYLRTYSGIKPYWELAIRKAISHGYAETFAGRRVMLNGNWSGERAWSLESTAINYPIQGTGGDQKYLALAVLKNYTAPRGIYLAWELHDGVYWYVPNTLVERARVEMKHILDNLPYKAAWGFTPPVPLPWDCKVGDTWGTLK
jgi:DNA polymerase I-like protein with 3'-5' exonuclease and polymerase domains